MKLYLFPWELPDSLEDHFSGPCLFMALYRLYRNAYFGQGFQLSGSFTQDRILKENIEKLPLDVKRVIFTKIWEKIEPSKAFIVQKGELLLDFGVHYLICQYSKLRTDIEVPQGYTCWCGRRISQTLCKFTYGPMNHSITPLILDFICRDKKTSLSPSFSLICPHTFTHVRF